MYFLSLLLTIFTFVEFNCENLFDCRDDSSADDQEWLSEGARKWTPDKYWRKLNRVGQTIISCGDTEQGWYLPDMVALCEVENDSVLHDLTRRSLLRSARYEYLVTHSADPRGIDVALLYSPLSFSLLRSYSLRVHPENNRHPLRDVLYAAGLTVTGDTLHVFVLHAPSRRGGKAQTAAYRERVAERVGQSVDSILHLQPSANIVIAGDFNDYTGDNTLKRYLSRGLTDISAGAKGRNGAKGTYKYRGRWGSLDHIFVSASMMPLCCECFVHDPAFLLEQDEKYGHVMPFRTYNGYRYNNGFSDHLPLVARFRLPEG